MNPSNGRQVTPPSWQRGFWFAAFAMTVLFVSVTGAKALVNGDDAPALHAADGAVPWTSKAVRALPARAIIEIVEPVAGRELGTVIFGDRGTAAPAPRLRGPR